MKKRIFIGIFLVFSLVIISCNLHEKSTKIDDDNILGIYLDNELQSNIPKKGEAVFSKAVCDSDEVNYYWDIDNWGLYVNNFSNKMKCNLYFVNYSGETTFDFDYTGGEQTFVVPASGTYRLETWGAQGGSYNSEFFGGYGGYSTGIIALKNSKNIFINVGGSGNTSLGLSTISNGGYNGGGSGKSSFNNANSFGSGGGGATHIAIKTGLLSTLENSKTDIIIVSGGGAGIYADLALFPSYSAFKIGHAGGYIGNKGVAHTYRDDIYSMSDGGTQIGGYSFGIGNSYSDNAYSETAGGGGGSGYIGNTLLTNKVMYCYDCEESSEESTKTISTTCSEETPTSYCAKKGNGYARITLVSID